MQHTDLRSPPTMVHHAVMTKADSVWLGQLRAALEHGGYTVTEVAPGQEAMEAFVAGAALVVWQQSSSDDIEQIRSLWMNACERSPQVMPVTALCTDHADIEAQRACLAVGFDEIFGAEDDPTRAAARLTGRVEARALHHQLGTIDPLTGLVSQQVFFSRLDPTVRLSSRAGMPMAVAVLDLDHMRRLERDKGRDVVRCVLKDFATHIRRILRRSDTVARLGDDRFGLILHQITAFEARKLLYQLWKGVTLNPETSAQLGETEGRVTFTAGVAVFPGDSSDATELYTRAEIALDVARASGHRRVLLYSETSGDAGSIRGSTDLRYHRVEDTRGGPE